MKETKYNQVKSASKAFNTLKTSFFIMLALTTIVSVGSIYLVRSAYKDALNRIYIRQGKQTYTARVSYDLEERKFDVEGHIEDFYLNMFAFDQHNFERNINRALALIGKEEKIMQSVGYSSNSMQSGDGNNNKNYSLQEKELIRPGEIMSLNQGEFVDKVTGAKGKKAFFYDKILIEEKRDSPILPFVDFGVQEVEIHLQNNFLRIHDEMHKILSIN
ncbi:MAG: hypothetical protein MI921_02960 [Cytophagales bacterium]|nr:hypothetical protein [Cytophagales bacterium]